MIHYILQIIAFQLLFLVTYDLFLKKETFFNWNRVYLLITPVLSFLLPLIRLDFIRQHIPTAYSIQLPEVLITNSPMQLHLLPEVVIGSESQVSNYITLIPVFGYLWYIGIAASLFLFLYKVFKIFKLKRSGTKIQAKNITLISLPNTTTAFSFFNTIYIGNNLSEIKKTNVLLHEKIHVREYHSLDLIFFELLRILFWFNPLIYIYQNRVAMLQEYIADAKAISETSKKEYYQNLLSQVFQTEKISFINTFFNHSLIKNRLVMLQKSKSKKIFQLKYLLLVPVVCMMLVYTSCTEDANAQLVNDSDNKSKSQSTILNNIAELKESIAAKGEMTEEERKALKGLLLLTTENGFSEPFFKDVVADAEIPFGVIENVPVFQGCEDLSREETKKCFSQKISQHVAKQFNTKIGEDLGLNGQQRIYVRFKIDNTGKIVGVQSRAPHPDLEKEAKRVINLLPEMIPGSQNGVNVNVQYSLPIVFELKE
ncbi:M56 family metallopeptidase [Aquimarina sp. 2201CG14-23]|uniref:M56 family metallopeptidase n=1 Tax=Aquimarina mycalae TaxID=3040073 RepID=UPI002477E285|nr:M56 family metallopeptidase [Aquimarina sp. 2201CG14-23]MDH7447344.1 M56 family metallopeptidase [Aquimarina sp. 2201CG14-23]